MNFYKNIFTRATSCGSRVDSNLSLDFPAYADFSFVESNIEVTPNHTTSDNIYWKEI